MNDLRRVERRWAGPVVRNLEPREAAVRELQVQEEIYRRLGAGDEAVITELLCEVQVGGYYVTSGFRVGGCPTFSEVVPTANTAIVGGITGCFKPPACGGQMILIGKPRPGVRLPVADLMQEQRAVTGYPGLTVPDCPDEALKDRFRFFPQCRLCLVIYPFDREDLLAQAWPVGWSPI